jgi:hypothetical protein
VGLPHLQPRHGAPRRRALLQPDGLHVRLLAHHDRLHLSRAVHLLHLLLQHRLSHSQEGVVVKREEEELLETEAALNSR